MPVVDMTVELREDDGETPIRDAFGLDPALPNVRDLLARAPALTVGRVCAHALHAAIDGERLNGEEKWARGVFADRIRSDPAAQLEAEEVALLKRLVGEVYSVPIVKRVFPLLDPDARPPRAR